MIKLLRRLLFCLLPLTVSVPGIVAQTNSSGVYAADLFAYWSVGQGINGSFSWPNPYVCQVSSSGITFPAFSNGQSVSIVDSNPSNSEVVRINTFYTSSAGCSISITPTHQHTSYYFATATGGLQEAINYAIGQGGGVVVLTPKWTTFGGTTSMVTSSPGSSTVSILDERTAQLVAYVWNGSHYVAQGSSGAVNSVFGRIGNVVATSGDYSFSLISGTAAPAQLPLFSNTAAGAVPASGGGTSNFLRADGSWAPPLSFTPTNAAVVPSTPPGAGQILVGNAGGTAYAPVTASGSCTLSSSGAFTCSGSAITLQTNTSANLSQVLLNMETSSANAVGLTITPSNPSGGIEKWEITGSSYTGNAATATAAAGLSGCSPSTAGSICYWNGSAWTLLAGNNSGTQYLQETVSGVPSWTTPPGTGNTTSTSLVTGFLPKANGANSIINSLCDEGITTANVFSCSDTAGAAFVGVKSTAGFVSSSALQGIDALGVGTGSLSGLTLPTNYVGFTGPVSGTPAYFIQLPSASPAGQVLSVAAPSSVNGVSQGVASWGPTTANIVLAVSPGAGIAHFPGSSQTVTSSALALTDMAAQAADTMVANMTAGSAAPTAVTIPTTAHGVWLGEGTATAPGVTAAGAAGSFLAGAGGSTDPSFVALSAINAQTATYQVVAADFSGYKTIAIASGTFTITLVASTSQPANGQYIKIINYGTGVVTVARSGQNLNGGTGSLTVAAGSATAPTGAYVESDGTNYEAALFGGSSGGSITGLSSDGTSLNYTGTGISLPFHYATTVGPTSNTTLNGAFASGATTMVLTSAAGYCSPTTNQICYVAVTGCGTWEIVGYTSVATNTLGGLSRSQFGTTACSSVGSGGTVYEIAAIDSFSTSVVPSMLQVWKGSTVFPSGNSNTGFWALNSLSTSTIFADNVVVESGFSALTVSAPGYNATGGSSTPALGAAGQVGTGSPAIACTTSHTCDQFSGDVTLTTGATGTITAGNIATVTFPNARLGQPNCPITISGGTTFLAPSYTATTSVLTFTVGVALANSTTYRLTYICGGI